jgi:hypothetical protein
VFSQWGHLGALAVCEWTGSDISGIASRYTDNVPLGV